MHTPFSSATRFKNIFVIIDIILLLFSSLVLLWSAFNNGYPLVYPDTGGYVDSSFTLEAPLNDRPLGYGLFLFSARLINSLWFPVFLQSLITALLLFRIAILILHNVKQKSLVAFGIIVVTTLTTDISKFVSWLMPDIFTSWLFLGGLLFFLSTLLIDNFFSAIVIIISFTVHNSHIFLVYVSILLLLFFFWKFRSKNNLVWLNSKKLLIIVLIASLGLCTLNFITNNGFTLTINNSVYLINKLAYNGILTKTLNKYCAVNDWKLCAYKEVIKTNEGISNWYFWADDSPMEKLGGWKKNNENKNEYQEIVFHSVKSFFPEIVSSSLKETYTQLISFRSSFGLGKFDESDAVFRILRNRFPGEFNEYINGKQNAGHGVRVRILPFNENIIQAFFSAASIIALFFFFYQKNYLFAGIISAPIIFILFNALIVGFTVSAEGRYHGKLLWMIPYFLFLSCTFLFTKSYILNKLKLQREV